ncbi:hypothetical protein EDB89DRAFT_2071052 [Lactarius sanguifluus]|nr:hypothetical protein EDB89DRAFT_2071052 [Lactarius sanguifluus]
MTGATKPQRPDHDCDHDDPKEMTTKTTATATRTTVATTTTMTTTWKEGRKTYIEQLEQTMTKLQTALTFSSE